MSRTQKEFPKSPKHRTQMHVGKDVGRAEQQRKTVDTGHSEGQAPWGGALGGSAIVPRMQPLKPHCYGL